MENQQEKVTQGVSQKSGWEKEVLEKLAFAAIDEQRKARRWGVFFKLLTFGYLLIILGIAVYPKLDSQLLGEEDEFHAAVVDVLGVIAEHEAANAESIIKGLRNAVKNKKTKGIILNINSPGGSPVQSRNIYDEILRLKEKHPDIPIYSVVGDICASGGYYIAAASDKIFVNQASIMGSIGVLMNGFGFVDVMDKLGVERRLLTAGNNKALMDPFSPVKEQHKQHMQGLLNQVHEQFIDAVREGRGERLQETPEMFTGLVWTGVEGVKMGLADDYGSVDSVARKVIGTKTKINFTPKEKVIDQFLGRIGTSFGQALGAMFKEFSMR